MRLALPLDMKMTNSDHSLVIAGVGAEGHGVLAGHRRGTGPMRLDTLTETARQAKIPDAWLPRAKAAKVQLTRAVRAIATATGYVAQPGTRLMTEMRAYANRWYLVSTQRPAAQDGTTPLAPLTPGEAFGTVVLVVTLYDDSTGQELIFQGDETLAARVRAQYENNVGSELFQASDVTDWLHEVYREHLDGVLCGTGWYIPRDHRLTAEMICEAFCVGLGWGEGWMCPPLPVATSAQLAYGIAQGLLDQVGGELTRLNDARKEARKAKDDPAADIGPRAAEGYALRLGIIRKRCISYAEILGADRLAECNLAIDDALVELDSALGGVTTEAGDMRDGVMAPLAVLDGDKTGATFTTTDGN